MVERNYRFLFLNTWLDPWKMLPCATGIGIIIRNHAPLIRVKVYDDIIREDKQNLYGSLKAWFEFVNIDTDPVVSAKLDAMLRNAFTHWKNRMHTAYNESKNAGLNPSEHCPFDWFDEGVWEAMCGTFEEPKFQRRSDINKNNRSKVQYPHASGSQSFHVRYYKMPEAERSHIKNWRDCHTKRNGCMVNDKAKSLAEEMDTKKRQLDEVGQEVVEEDILADTLGTKTGYRKGMGYGFVCSQPAKRICNSEALKNAQTTIEQQKLMIDDLRSELGTMKESQNKLQSDMDKLLAIFGNF